MEMEIAGWCVYVDGEFDQSLIGDRKIRAIKNPTTCIYCEDEVDAKELSEKIEGSKFGNYYTLNFSKNASINDDGNY